MLWFKHRGSATLPQVEELTSNTTGDYNIPQEEKLYIQTLWVITTLLQAKNFVLKYFRLSNMASGYQALFSNTTVIHTASV